MADLTTLAAVRSFLQKGTTETGQDVIIGSLITRASRLIEAETGREFTPTTGQARTFVHREGRLLQVGDLRSVTSIVLDTQLAASSQTTLASTDYALRPKPARDGIYQWVRLPGYPGVVDREVTITGDWGFATIPDDVAHACIVTVAIWLRRDVAAFERTFSIEEDRLERPQALPSAVRSGLAHYRRVGSP